MMDSLLAGSTIWWLLAGGFVVLELLTGTFYLLMLALGLAAGAMAAHAGFSTGWQYLVAALVGGGAVLAWHLKQAKNKSVDGISTESNQNVHIDIGSTVEVSQWSPLGSAQVVHRGAEWAARLSASGLQGSDTFASGLHRIAAVEGNTLVLIKI
jgi:membrane protein implicated in regulation of membrane protease activity